MTAVIQDVAAVCNLALAKAGYRLRIGSVYDGTLAAKKLLDIYGITRDALLRAGDWNFAQRIAPLVNSPRAVPPSPWTNAYVYPDDCLRVRNVYDPSATTDVNNPLPTLWQVADDATIGARVIWTRANTATCVYNAQVTNPAQWDPMFTDAFGTALMRNLRSLAEKDDVNYAKLTDQELGAEVQAANEVVG